MSSSVNLSSTREIKNETAKEDVDGTNSSNIHESTTKIKDNVSSKDNNQHSVNDDNDYDNKTPEQLSKIYEEYRNRFKVAMEKSNQLFESQQNHFITLSYYYRRDQIYLSILNDLYAANEDEINIDEDFGVSRLEDLIAKVPRTKKILTPIIKLIKHSTITDKRDELRIGNYMIEKVSDLINDDLTKYHTNPQSIENWCHRNSVPNLISGNYVPIILDNNNDYNGIEYNLNLNDEGHQGTTSSTNTTANLNSNTGSVNNSANTHTRKKRKVESTKK